MQSKKILFKLGTKGICAVLAIIGTLCIIVGTVQFKNPYSWWTAWGSSVANTLGTTLVASCVVSFVLEISNINTILQNVMGNVLNDDFPLDAYSDKNLTNFKSKISLHQCKEGMEREQLETGIYKYEKNLLELANEVYYEYHKAQYTIEPNENEGIFNVKAHMEYKIVNKFGAPNVMRFKIRTYAISETDPKKDYENNFKLESFKINKKKVSNPNIKIEEIEKDADSNFYDYKVKIEEDFGNAKNTVVDMKYSYNIPISDQIQSYKITFPCKKLEHQMRIKEDNETKEKWQIKTNAFTSFYYRQKDADSKFKVEQNGNDMCTIKFDDWIIPGGGYVNYFCKK